MTPRQFYYPRVVIQFYHSMTSRDCRVRWSSDSLLTIDRECSELRTFPLQWACQQSWPILEDIGIGHSHHRGRWSAVSLEILRRDPCSSGGSSRLRFFWWTTCSRLACSRCSTTYSAGEPYSRPLYRISEGF